jgi:outer membrane protein insertion porin family
MVPSGLADEDKVPFSDASVQPVQYGAPAQSPPAASSAPSAPFDPMTPSSPPSGFATGPGPAFPDVGPIPASPESVLGVPPPPGQTADLIVDLEETQTGRFMFGVGVNSDAGLTAQIVIDEQNFDWRRMPRSFDDFINGTAFRGGGQRLRIEAIPGSEVQRYLVNFTEPYLLDTALSLNLSGYLYDRRFYDWDEQRLGGRIGLGYRITPDLSLSVSTRLENVNINDPRVLGVMELDEVLGDNGLYTGGVTLTHDTRDIPFAATEGHLLELNYEQAFGTFDYPRGNIDYRRYFLIRQRADGSGRHTLAASIQAGFTGSQTPIFENYFAGGYSTLRGFRFRHASPKVNGVIVGGEFSLLGSAEYLFPVTADDMLKGVVFVDYGTVEEEIEINKDDFRVAVGMGLRVSVPAMGPAPIALDFAVPVAREDTDRIQNFSFFVGFGR